MINNDAKDLVLMLFKLQSLQVKDLSQSCVFTQDQIQRAVTGLKLSDQRKHDAMDSIVTSECGFIEDNGFFNIDATRVLPLLR